MGNQHEPVELDIDLAATQPFGRRLSGERRARIAQEINRLREKLGLIASIATQTRRGSLIEDRFRELQRKEHFEHPLPGIESLSYKLEVHRFPRNDRELRATLYALLRLRIAQRVVELVRAENVSVSLPESLTLFRMEGNLDVPLALDRLGDGITPPDLTENPFGNVAPLFKGPHHTYFIQKMSHPPRELERYVEGIQRLVTTHKEMIRSLAKGETFSRHDALKWLESGKKGAMTLYLHILVGLDKYAEGIYPPPGAFDRQLNDFKCQYARNRVFIDPKQSFANELIRGTEVYRAITGTTLEGFRGGQLEPQAIVATTFMRDRNTRLHHFLPKDPVEFAAVLVLESVMTLEALRCAPLINGGPVFDPPLPYFVAYIRYNAGDIRFLVLLLTLLEAIVFGKTAEPKYAKLEQPPLNNLKRQLAAFERPENQAVWTVLQRWRTESASYYLKQLPVAREIELRLAIAEDARMMSLDLHGPNERQHMARLNNEGEMDTTQPLLKALNAQELWLDLQQAMVAHIGTDRKPWLGHSGLLEDYMEKIGRRALRFYYMHRGFHQAFQGVEREMERL